MTDRIPADYRQGVVVRGSHGGAMTDTTPTTNPVAWFEIGTADPDAARTYNKNGTR